MPEDDDYFDTLLGGAGCGRGVIAHCHAVRDLALTFSDCHGILDRHLLTAGALLHDIGRGTTHSLHHARAGAEYCRKKGIPEPVAHIVECHTGAGLTADECTLLRLMPIDCMPRTSEEKVVTNADNLLHGTTEVSIYGRLGSALYLDREIRLRMYRLWLYCEQIRRSSPS